MTMLKVDTVSNGDWNLPSVKDLINSVDTPRGPSPSVAPSVQTLCQSCLTKDRKVPIIDGKPCSYCVADRQYATQYPPTPTVSFGYDQVQFQPDPGYFSRRSSIADQSYHSDSFHSVKPEPYTHSPTFPMSTPISIPIHPTQTVQRHHSHSGYVSSRPRLNVSTGSPYGLTPAKIASNDRHKLSEKHRRDGMGAFVQAGDVLRKGLNPGLISRCSVCISDASQSSSNSSPTTSPHTHSTVLNSMSSSNCSRPKKPKNDMLEESLMWEFSWVLHMVPEEVGSHLEGIRELAGQMARDKEFGIRNDWAKRKKWDADVRAEVLEQALRLMEGECERHGVDAWVREDGRGKRRRIDDAEEILAVPVLTPPSSRSSPTFGPMPSRESSEDDDESRRLR